MTIEEAREILKILTDVDHSCYNNYLQRQGFNLHKNLAVAAVKEKLWELLGKT